MVQKSEDAPRYGRRKPIDWRRARGMLRMVLSLGLLILAVSQSAHARYYTVINPGSVKVYKGSLFEACKHSRDVNYPSFQKLVSVEYYNDIGSGKVGGVFCKWQGQYPAPIPITHGKIECDAGEYVDDSAYLGCRKIEPEPFCSIDEPVVGGAAGGQGGSAAAPASRAPFSAGVDVGSGTPHVNAGDFGATQSVHGGVGGMSRTYSPLNKSGGATGVGWSTPVDRSVTALASTPVTVPDARGWMTSFKTTTGGFAPAYWNAISFSGSRTDVNRSLTSFSNNGWQFRNESGIFETYGANGALGQIRDDRTGEALTLVRSPSRPAILLRDQYGRTMTASQGANGLIDKLIDSSGREIIYQYVDRGGPWAGITVAPNVGANKILSKVIYPDNTPATLTDNPAHTYEYSDANFPDNLTGIRDERGVLVLFIAYDAQGRVTEMSGAGGANRKTIAYDVVANTRTVTNALGKSTVYQLEIAQGHYRVTAINGQPSANCAAANTAYAYDAIGFKNQETSAEGIVTKLQNDGKGRVLTRTDDFGGANARAVTTAWNTAFEQPAVVTEPNRTTTYNRDAAGRLLSVTVADTTTHTVPYSTNGQQRTWTNAYASLPAGLPSEPYGATALVVVNGDAETNSLFGWTVNDGSYTVIATNAATNAASKAFKSGNAAVNRMSQTIALPTARNAQIDAGLAMVTANWFQRGSSAANNDDPVTVEMTFLNSGGSPIGAMIASPAKAANNAWTAREFSALAPANARSVKIGLVCTIAYAATNTVCNADIDDLTLAGC